MNETTVHTLNEINLAFYRRRAGEFSATREFPWPGWIRLMEHFKARSNARVLDVGCGNGRFAAYLAEQLATRQPAGAAPLEYFGADASAPLLAFAARRTLPSLRAHFTELDFVRAPTELPACPPGPFDLVVLLGVLHGVPGHAQRRALVREAARRVVPGGLLAMTCWRFAEIERFKRRLVSWDTYNAGATEPVERGELERGDHLLPWGRGSSAVRYCHATDEPELERLVCGLGLEPVDRYLADGRSGDLNRYAIYRATHERESNQP